MLLRGSGVQQSEKQELPFFMCQGQVKLSTLPRIRQRRKRLQAAFTGLRSGRPPVLLFLRTTFLC